MNGPLPPRPRRTNNRYLDMIRDVNFSQFKADPARDEANLKARNDSEFWGNAANLGLSGLGTVAGTAIGAGVGAMAGGIGAVPGAAIGGGIGTAAGQALGGMAKNAITTHNANQSTDDELRARREAALMNAIAMLR
jgi:hypothetical protein